MSKQAIVILYILVLMVTNGFTQERSNIEACFDNIKKLEFQAARTAVSAIANERLRHSLNELIFVLEHVGQVDDVSRFRAANIHEIANDDLVRCIKLLTQSSAEIAYNQVKDHTLSHLTEALELSEKLPYRVIDKQILLTIISQFRKDVNQISNEYLYFLESYRKAGQDEIDEAHFAISNFVFQSKSSAPVDDHFHEAVRMMDTAFSKIDKSSKLYPIYYFEKAIYYEIIAEDQKAREYIDLLRNATSNTPYYRYINFGLYLKLSQIAGKSGNYEEAWRLLENTKNYKDQSHPELSDYYYYLYGARYFEGTGEKDKAYELLANARNLELSIDEQNMKVSRYISQEVYRTLQNEKRIQQAMNLIIILAVLTVLAFVVIMFYRTRQKMMKEVSTKNEEIYNREIQQLLSEQELKSINSMLEGQEKERKRVAEDLHDRLGSTLTAARMYLEAINNKNGELNKVGDLVDQALSDTREISHNMLSGVLTKFGLVPALVDLKEIIEGTNQIKVNLNCDVLSERLEGQVEINIYRIIQELFSNTLKYAKASKVNIDFWKSDDHINVKYADDGIGITPDEMEQAAGIGFKNMAARISKINGEWSIKAQTNEGFQLDFNFPLNLMSDEN